tara:strand:- start:98 stop:280 length:183 start_codon:yes stop_codon:yes gene_type:complete
MGDADLEGLAAFTAYVREREPVDFNTADIEKVVNFIKEKWSSDRIEKLIKGLTHNENYES